MFVLTMSEIHVHLHLLADGFRENILAMHSWEGWTLGSVAPSYPGLG